MGLEDPNHHSEKEMDLEDPNHETEELARWAVSNNISHKATTDLLKVLQHVIPDLPNDSRTLLGTNKIIKCTTLAGEDYFYFGVQYWLEKYVNLMGANILHININVDGIPLFKSSTTSLWPILAYLIIMRYFSFVLNEIKFVSNVKKCVLLFMIQMILWKPEQGQNCLRRH